MSLINKMLQDLDRRHASPSAGAPPGQVPDRILQPVRGVPRALGSEWYRRVVGVLIIVAIGWIAWVAWQVTPQVKLTEPALQSANLARPASAPPAAATVAASAPAPAAVSPTPVSAAPVAAAPIAATPVASTPVLSAGSAKPEVDRADMSMPGRKILAPLRQQGARASAATKVAKVEEPERNAVTAPLAQSAMKLETTLVPPRTGALPASGQINKHDSATPRDRAAAEYRRAVSFVNQGRIAEGMEAFRAALTFDPGYEAARQTQVALLLEAKRMDEAAGLLQEGIALNPENTGFISLLARIMVERNDDAGALALLQQHAAAAAGNADYHAFAAALYQRLGRHGEAVNEYGAALRIAPASGVWWVGLGISQEALQQAAEAAASFRRAKETGTLNAELAGFVERKLKALR